jgi:hypothetical protein
MAIEKAIISQVPMSVFAGKIPTQMLILMENSENEWSTRY